MGAHDVHERHIVKHRYELESSSDWDALCDFAPRWGLKPEEFMWMGVAWFLDGTEVHSYKHRDTRRNLNLDTCGRTYQWMSLIGAYQASDVTDAVRWVKG